MEFCPKCEEHMTQNDDGLLSCPKCNYLKEKTDKPCEECGEIECTEDCKCEECKEKKGDSSITIDKSGELGKAIADEEMRKRQNYTSGYGGVANKDRGKK